MRSTRWRFVGEEAARPLRGSLEDVALTECSDLFGILLYEAIAVERMRESLREIREMLEILEDKIKE